MKKTVSILLTGLLAVTGVCGVSAATVKNNTKQATAATSATAPTSATEQATDPTSHCTELPKDNKGDESTTFEFPSDGSGNATNTYEVVGTNEDGTPIVKITANPSDENSIDITEDMIVEESPIKLVDIKDATKVNEDGTFFIDDQKDIQNDDTTKYFEFPSDGSENPDCTYEVVGTNEDGTPIIKVTVNQNN